MGLFSLFDRQQEAPTPVERLFKAADEVNAALRELGPDERHLRVFTVGPREAPDGKPRILIGYWDAHSCGADFVPIHGEYDAKP